MMKYVLILAAMLAGYVYYQHICLQKSQQSNMLLRQQNEILQQNQEKLIKQREEYYAKQQKANEQIAKLKTKVLLKQDDCYYRALPNDYLEFVRGTKNNHR